MPLDQNQINKVNAWMNSHGVNNNCPACGRANMWQIGDVVAPPVMIGNNINLGGPSVPMVQVLCGNCAHVMLFAAVPIGLIG